MAEPGRVVALEANYCRVDLDRPGPSGHERLLCTRRTRLAKGGLSIAVGDAVEVEDIDWVERRGVIARRGPRRNLLPRPPVANVSRVVVVVSLKEPQPDPLQITRFLVNAEDLDLPVELVLSKAEGLPEAWLEEWCGRLESWGYRPLPISTRDGRGLPALASRLSQPGITVLCGPSGVGKSSLLNALVPGLALRVAPVSGRLRRGRHTTRHVGLVALPGAPGALVADTPGFNRPALPKTPADLARCFPDLRQLTREPCRFPDCRHDGGAGCVVPASWPRRALYQQCLADVEALVAEGRGMGRPRETALQEASRRRRQRHRQGEFSPPDLED
ncbi:MAG: ribosome small subunit-dependent GTPase A [Cyanobacteriota bacterium]|nr:ribosome small subunit-dependent GTPase A [Cyanobacteriota bacterium]